VDLGVSVVKLFERNLHRRDTEIHRGTERLLDWLDPRQPNYTGGLLVRRGFILVTCFIRYMIDPNNLTAFEQYARVWMRLIEKYGGTHLGYFVPGDVPPAASFSFPGLGKEGPSNVAIAVFSFPTVEAYEKYRVDVAADPECIAETRHRNETNCFTSYERTFMRPISRS
jgi:hypothetical protein